ncbi:hypothetical protein [Streptomyces sp. UG1]
MPHILTSALANVAIALLEALIMRVLIQLWNSFARSGRPVASMA